MKDILHPLVKQFMPFAQKRMGFDKPPRLFLRNDPENAQNPLGKTAYYDPEQMSVTLYINGRHPKDIMRSLSHELVHHTQNCNGQFDGTYEMGEGYAQNDEHLREMEREAYEQGNLCFRDWEDSIKGTIYIQNMNVNIQKEGKNKMSLNDWKNNELKTLLSEKWGFSFNLLNESQEEAADDETLNEEEDDELEEGAASSGRAVTPDRGGEDRRAGDERKRPMEEAEGQAFAPNHYCVHHGGVERNGSVELAEAVTHNYNKKLGRVTHYDMKFADGTIMENVAFEDIQVTDASLAEEHKHSPGSRDEKPKDLDEAEEKKGKYDDGDNTDEKCDHVPCKDQDKKEKMNEQKIRRIIRKLVKEAMTKKAK